MLFIGMSLAAIVLLVGFAVDSIILIMPFVPCRGGLLFSPVGCPLGTDQQQRFRLSSSPYLCSRPQDGAVHFVTKKVMRSRGCGENSRMKR